MHMDHEDERLAFLRELEIEGSAPEAAFDRIASMAAEFFDVPMAAVTLVGRDRQWIKAKIGIDVDHIPRCQSFCSHAIEARDVMVVLDARRDPRFRESPLVVGDPGVRFYAGAPLHARNGHRLGAVCVLDRSPRTAFSDRDRRRLAALAEMAMGEIEHRHLRHVSLVAKGFVDRTDDVLVCTRADGHIIYVNPAVERLFGYSPSELIRKNIAMIVPDRFKVAHRHGMERVAAGTSSKLSGKTIEAIGLRKDGSEVWIDLSLRVWHDERSVNVGATMRDITKRKSKTESLKLRAHYDTLTGLSRGHAFEDRLDEALAADDDLAVLVLEIDGLKDVNDSLGHRIGDALLQAITIRLVAGVPHGSHLARWGGDVFAVMLPHERDPAQIRERAQDIQMVLAEPFTLDGHMIVIGASIGAAFAPDHAGGGRELIAAADLALHHAKRERGQRFSLFDQTMQTSSARRRAFRDEVRLGFDANQFTLFYQPQVSLGTGALVGAEALMRWYHPVQGLLAPDAFIPAIDDNTLALQAGWWSIDQACRRIATRRAEQRPPLRISVNLFAAQLRYGGLVATIRELLAAYDVPPELLDLEVRETIANQDDDAVIAILRQLRDIGLGIALDDFGTGYASLRTLKQLPVSTLKIDQGFVRDMCDSRRDAAIVAAILGVGKEFGIDIIAEGVETQAQARLLTSMGCPTAQGYLYGRPGAAADFDAHWTDKDGAGPSRFPSAFDALPTIPVANRRGRR